MTDQASPRVWFITGVSSGLGLALAKAALAAGDVVAGTARRETDRAAFKALDPERALGLVMDVRDEAAVRAAISAAEARFGRIDILVNNAGYGLIGALEETSLAEMRDQFEVNVFGAIAVMQAALPGMRRRRAGVILTITSVSGLAAWGGTATYTASKFALEGATQCLAQEVAELGIKVINVAPGGLRTDYAGRSLVLSEKTIDDYDGQGHLPRRMLVAGAGHENGDPDKAAAAILKVLEAETPPMHLLLGADAVHYATQAAGRLQHDLGEWIGLTTSIAAD
ncbi:MAG: SDR family NAD(P)-dependent oxidoreductase [Proteobacteria bacterium]|nr:SDR family NAD(P)-dependent oxidoreductase [Pseudomonadota bacterium]